MKRVPMARIREAWLDDTLTTAQAAEQVGLTRANFWRRAKALGLPPRKRGKPWRIASDREAEFTDMWQRGVPVAEMARHFDIAPSGIIYRRKALGLPGRSHDLRHFAVGREDEFAAMWIAGIDSTAIGAQFGQSARTVVERAHLMGLPRRPRGRPGLPIEAWQEMRLAALLAEAAQREQRAARERAACEKVAA